MKPAARAKTTLFDRPEAATGGLEDETTAKAEFVLPTDYEKRLFSPDVLNDSLAREVLLYPANDVSVEIERRVSRIAIQSYRKEDLASLPVHVRDCVELFTRDWVVVKHLNEYYSRNIPNVFEGKEPTYPPQLYEVDATIKAESPEDSSRRNLERDLLKTPTRETRTSDQQLRAKDRFRIFSFFKDFEKQVVSSDRRAKGSPPMENIGYTMLVSAKELKFQLSEMEPFWCTLCIYDVRAKRKVTGDFHFDLVSDQILNALKGRPSPIEAPSCSLDAVFAMQHMNPDYHLVLRVYKLLTGEQDKAIEPYLKATQMKPKEIQKLQQEILGACERLANYAMPFAIGAVPLFAKADSSAGDGNFIYTSSPVVSFQHLARYTENIGEDNLETYVTRLLNEKERKKLKLIPGRAAVEIRILTSNSEDPTARRLNPSLFNVLPQTDRPLKVIREIQEFYQDDQCLTPNLSYVNHLYIYPVNANFSNYNGSAKHRNVAINVKVKDSDANPNDPGLKRLYGRSHAPALVMDLNTGVSYHDEKPQFSDEFKIELPQILNPRLHALFTFNHIVCQDPGKKSKEFRAEMLCAAVALPLYRKDGLVIIDDGQHALLPVVQLPAQYLTNTDDDIIKYVTKSPCFFVRTKLVSSIYTQDPALNAFFNKYDSGRDDQQLIDSIRGLGKMQKHVAIRFLPVILNELFRIMVVGSESSSKAALHAVFPIIAHTQLALHEGNTEASRSPLLLSYIHYIFDNIADAKKFLHEEIVRDYILLLKDKPEDVHDLMLRYSWFIFELIIKSMTLKLAQTRELADDRTRPRRFSEIFYDLMEALLGALAKEVQTRTTSGLNLARELNKNVGFFVKDLANICDRGQFFRMVHVYVNLLHPQNTDTNLVAFKFAFLRILTDHEYYVPLNMPVAEYIPSVATLPQQFWNRHFLAGTLIQQLEAVQNHPEKVVRSGAIATFRALLVRHDIDPRYQNPEAKQRILAIYLPYVLMLLEPQTSIVLKVRDKEKEELQHWMVCAAYLIAGIDRRLLRDWWKKETQKRLLNFFILLARCLDVFEYSGVEAANMGTGASTPGGSPVTPPATGDVERQYDDPMGIRRQTQQNTLRRFAMNKSKRATAAVIADKINEKRILLDQNLNREVSLLVLDILADFLEDFEWDLEKDQSVFMRNFFEIVLLLLKKNQPQSVITSTWRFVRVLVFTLGKQFFTYNTSFAGELTYEVLRLCTFSDSKTRGEASAILYLLMRRNYDELKQFARMKLQATIALSKLVGEGGISDDRVFVTALESVREHSRSEDRGNDFGKQVEDLIERLFTVLRNSKKLEEFKYDPEQTADLYYQISKGYVDSPDLRVTWLENLANYHRLKENFFEAAQCRIHISAMIAEYLKLIKPAEAIHVAKHAFMRLSPNILEDMTIPEGVGKNESICQGAVFSRKGLFDNLFEAVGLLKSSDLYESAIEVERFMAAIHKKNRQYAKLAECYNELHQFCEKIVQANQTNSRLFSNYYRVAFFGDLLPDQNGKEYIYKEPPMVRLADIAERLKQQYTAKLGPNKVVLLPNKPVDKASIQAGMLYLQIVSVDEYLEPHELKDRVTPFERKFNLKRFIFETPFTTTGKAQGDFKEQCKRKTILTTELPFPYIKKRIVVKDKFEMTLSPIETSTEIIEGRVNALKSEVESPNASTKTLQIVLQGSVLLQVNAGPLEICRIFLGNPAEFPADKVEKLRQKMRDFVHFCYLGVQLNRRLIKVDQKVLQEKLEEGYMDLLQKVAGYKLGEFQTFVIKPEVAPVPVLKDSHGGSQDGKRSSGQL